ncbi:MAG: type IX secretion system sortase PorU, partial [Ignavibacteriales bacterium]|nr:type IX secretion system sortase PorU [Ignavibacteriales bacterium]
MILVPLWSTFKKELNVTPRKILSHIVKGSFLIKRFWFVQVVFGNSLYHVGGMPEPNERAFSPHRLFSFMRFHVTLIVVLVAAGHASADLERRSEEPRSGFEQTERVQTTQTPLSQGEWFKIIVQESGIYRLDRSLLLTAGIPPEAFVNIGSFRIFGNGGQPLPEDILVPRPAGLQEVRRMVVDRNGNGAFDAEDLILFFGTGPTRWRYTAGSGFSHAINPYSDHNAYFVTFGGAAGRAMDSVASLTTPSPFVPGDVGGMEFVEEEKVNLLNSGREWYGEVLNSQAPARTYSTILPGIDASKPVVYRVAVLGRTDRTEAFVVSENGQTLGNPIAIFPVIIGSLESNYAYVAPVTSYVRTGPITGERSNLRFEFQTAKGEGWVNWFEIFYRRKPEAVNDVLMFPTPDTTAVTEFRLSGFNSDQTMVFDVTRHDSVVRIVNLRFDQVDPGKCTFQYSHIAGDVRTLLAAGPSAWKIPLSIAKVENSSLRSSTGGAEFVIINPAEFVAEAERLRQYRIQRDSIMTTVVSVESIMNEFGGGLTDPIAIRDFLAHARATWTVAPKYVLLFGDGHYDYRGLVSSRRNWIPPYESAESIHQIQTYASDDILARLVAGEQRTSLAIGRLPVGSVGEARNAVDKILAYGTTAPFGSWRNRVTFVADDGLTSTGDDGSLHTSQADALSRFYTPEDVEKKKIYIVEYPTINSSSGRRKPAASEAIVRAINEGTLILNYTGHGNPDVWAHEAVFTRDGSLPLLKNGDNLFLLVAATCDFARYDQPDETSAGELLITMGKSGAIAVVTASRAVYSLDNLQFNNTLFTELFRREADGRPSRIGDAFFRTKQIHYSLNDLKYHLFGDPTMRLNLPFHTGRVDSLKGDPTTTPVQLRALEKVVVSGGVWKADG